MSNTIVANVKNISVEQVSTIVVISGAAMIAGSRCSFLAAIGSIQAMSFESTTVAMIAILTVNASL